MDTQPVSRSAIPRRGPQLAPIRTDLPRPVQRSPVLQKSRPQRPRPNEISHSPAGERVPLQRSPVKRQSSKSNLKNLFIRNKSVRDLKRQNHLAAVGERRESATDSAYAAETPLSPTSTVLSTPTVVASPTIYPSTSGNLSKTPSKKEKKKPLHPATSPWVPPPLFQAYPQAVKHACLATPNLSADSILRIQAARRKSSAGETTQDVGSQKQSSTVSDAAKKKEDREKRKHERKMSGSISKALWTKKIFVLVTSGCLLQYAGDGNFDRLPEKMMRLGPASAAFASDAIPGKPWVLQISETSYEDGRVAMDSQRRFLSRFGFHSADSRRSTRSFFMVFTDPDEMNAWLVTLRREIESLGGKKYVPERESDDEGKSPQVHNRPLLVANGLRSRSSFRKSSLPEPNQLLPVHTPTGRSPASTIRGRTSYQELAMNTKAMNRRSMPSSDTLSISTATTQRDADTIHEYPEDSRSPTIASSTLTPVRPQPAVPRHRRKAPAMVSNQDRRSMYAYSSTQSDRQVKDVEVSTRPLSLIGGDVSRLQSPSPSPHPNFSVPSFSRRFTMSRGSSRSQDSLSVRGDESVPSSPKDFQSVARPREGFAEMPSASVSNPHKRQSLVYESSFIRDPTPSPSSFSGSRTGALPSSGRYHRGVQSPESPSLPLQTNVPQPDIQSTSKNSIRPQPSLHASSKLPKPDNDSRFSGSHQVRFPFMSASRSQTPSSLRRGSQPELSPSPSVSTSSSYINTTTSTLTSKPSKVLPRANSSTSALSSSSPRGTRLQQRRPSKLSLLTPPPPTQLSERKSMPNLSLMAPPVGPPPDCPLPDIPPDIASQHHPAWRKIPTAS